MPSTDVDGSPILIVGREDAELIADLLFVVWSHHDPQPAEEQLANKLKETFGIEF